MRPCQKKKANKHPTAERIPCNIPSVTLPSWPQSSAHILLWSSILAFLSCSNAALFPCLLGGLPMTRCYPDQEATYYALVRPAALFLHSRLPWTSSLTALLPRGAPHSCSSSSHSWLETTSLLCILFTCHHVFHLLQLPLHESLLNYHAHVYNLFPSRTLKVEHTLRRKLPTMSTFVGFCQAHNCSVDSLSRSTEHSVRLLDLDLIGFII